MEIKYKRKVINNVTTVDEMVQFINKKVIYKNFKGFRHDYIPKIQDKIDSTEYLNYKGIKVFLKDFMGPVSNRSLDFWFCRGFSEEESKEIIYDLQSKSSKCVDYEKRLLPSNKEYWLNKGYSLEESLSKVKERQTTFSLDKCIDNYGYSEGVKIFNQRQEKWLESITKTRISTGGFNQDCRSVEYYQGKYDKDWDNHMLSGNTYTDTNRFVLLDLLKFGDDIESLIEYIKDELEFNSIKDLDFIFKSAVMQEIHNLSYENLKTKILEDIGVVKTKFSNYWFSDGNRYNSNGEYQISKHLKRMGIDFKHDEWYPDGKKYRYDFYLTKYDTYIEYFGFIKNVGYVDNKMLDEYSRKMGDKIVFFKDNGYNVIYDTSVSEIIKKLNKEYGNKGK